MINLTNAILDTLLQSFDPNQFNGYMILGYVVMWLIVMGYILILANRQRNVKEEVELLQQLLKEDEEADSQ
ncbi:MAG: CcmD family protein [Chloroflexota bacterium]|jgi:CcmD family protein